MHANYTSFALEMWFVGPNDIVHKKITCCPLGRKEENYLSQPGGISHLILQIVKKVNFN